MIVIALHKSRGFASRLIRWQTRSQYSHASILLKNQGDDPIIKWRHWEALQGKGVLKHNYRDLRRVDADLFEVMDTGDLNTQHPEVMAFLDRQVGKKYDWTSVFRFVSRRQASRKSSGKWFCSELVFAAVQKEMVHPRIMSVQDRVNLLGRTQPWEVSPGLLARSPLIKPLGEV